MPRFVVVGNGLAGHRAAMELRAYSDDAEITLVGSEPGLPYERPPLTKEFLLGRMEPEALILKGAVNYSERGIAYYPSVCVTGIDRRERRVLMREARDFEYDKLLLATGSRPRQIPGVAPSPHVHYIRTLPDAVRLRGALREGRHIAIVGGGFIGLEVAAAARALGCRVSVIEANDRLLARGMPPSVSAFMHALHVAEGVDIILGAPVHGISEGERGGALLQFADGTLRADAVVVGIGVIPNSELAEAAGLAVDGGIVVDRQCRTADPAIFAAGEVTVHPTSASGAMRRVETWRTAVEQPRVAAACMTGRDAAFDEPPWLWSDQYEINFQMIGAPDEGVAYFLREEAHARRWTLIGINEEGRPVGAVAANNGRDISMLRRILRTGAFLPGSITNGLSSMEQPTFSEAMLTSVRRARASGMTM